jgi:hypothetical protein
MSRPKKYNRRYVRTILPEQMKKKLRDQGLRTDVRPKAEWPRNNGFAGIESYAGRQGKTVTEVLVNECGFEPRETSDYPGTHQETKDLIVDFVGDEQNRYNRLNDRSIPSKESGIRKVMKVSLQLHGTSNLLRFERYDYSVAFAELSAIFGYLNDNFPDGTCKNYHRALAEVLEHAYDAGYIEERQSTKRAIERIPERFHWNPGSQPPEEILAVSQVAAMWEAARSTDEEAILILYGASPCRTNDPRYHIQDLREALVLDEYDPRIEFQSRKNVPGTGAIMAGTDVLKRLIELRKEDPDWDGEPFPSERTNDGRRSGSWINDQIEEIAIRAGVTINGETPTAGDLRDFYMNLETTALDEFREISDEAAAIAGNKRGDILEDAYLLKRLKRIQFRRFAHQTFKKAFPGTTVPEPLDIDEFLETLEPQTDQDSSEETDSTDAGIIKTKLSDFSNDLINDESASAPCDPISAILFQLYGVLSGR